MQNIEEFAGRLIEEKGFDTKDAEIVSQLKADLSERIVDQVNAMIMSHMPEEALEGFNKALDGSDEEVREYAKKYIPDMEEKIAGVLLSFKSMYLA
jgi:hypothetical protein